MATVVAKKKEAAVISLALLSACIAADLEEEAIDAPPGTLARPPPKLEDATAIALSFRNLLRIENLDVLRSLKKLQLDNNALTKIEGLTAVPHLEWLDLSFNRIKKIEGIAHLTRLTDLSLYSNDISVVEGLDTLTALQYLSLGNNALANINTVLAFRSLPALEALTLEGNPLCKPVEGSRDSYSVWAAAFLPRLKYLDARLVTTADKAAARDGGVPAEKLAEVEEAAAAADKVARARAERAALVARLTDANLEAAATFPDELWEEPELAKLNAWGLPGLPPLMAALAEALKGPATDFMDLGGDKDRRIRDELSLFEDALRETLAEASAASVAQLESQRTALKRAARELRASRGGTSPAAVAALVARFTADVDAMGDSLLRREVAAHEAVEAMLDVLESAVLELRGVKLAQHDVFFRALEAAVALFTDGLAKTAEALMLDADADRLPSELDEELSSLLNDREAMLGVLAASADARVARILRREAELRAREDARCTGAVKAARAGELARNRARVVEIKAVVAEAKARIARELTAAAEEEDDEPEPVKR